MSRPSPLSEEAASGFVNRAVALDVPAHSVTVDSVGDVVADHVSDLPTPPPCAIGDAAATVAAMPDYAGEEEAEPDPFGWGLELS